MYTPALTDSYTPPGVTVTVASIYTKGIPVLAPDFEYVGFRPAMDGEYVVCTDGRLYIWKKCTYLSGSITPVLVARKIPKTVYSFRKIGWGCPNNQFIQTRHGSFIMETSNQPHDLYSLTVTEE